MYPGMRNNSLEHACAHIARMPHVESADVTDQGVINVVLDSNAGLDLKESILDISRRTMLPVAVSQRSTKPATNAPQRTSSNTTKNEWVQDYYKTIAVGGFATAPVEAPPEEVASEPKGALKLQRIRSKNRGRAVVGWKLGDDEVRVGSKIKFTKHAALQWNMGRTLNVNPGATATVNTLSSRRPLVFLQIGSDYSGIEMPIHMLGHLCQIEHPTKPVGEAKSAKKSELAKNPGLNKLMKAVGYGRNPDDDDSPTDQPFYKDGWKTTPGASANISPEAGVEYEDYDGVDIGDPLDA